MINNFQLNYIFDEVFCVIVDPISREKAALMIGGGMGGSGNGNGDDNGDD